jgi:predicted lipoprotein with Yx(FWY)xxD motif
MRIPAILAVAATAVLTLGACGGNTTAPAAAPQAGSGNGASGLHVASTSLGRVLVDASGRTVYLLTADGHNLSTCSSSCLQFWRTVTPGGHAGITAPVSATATPSGRRTATVAGHPVYTFAEDHAPGDVNGEGLQEFGGSWYAVSASGKAVQPGGSSSSSSASPAPGSAQSSAPAYGRGY